VASVDWSQNTKAPVVFDPLSSAPSGLRACSFKLLTTCICKTTPCRITTEQKNKKTKKHHPQPTGTTGLVFQHVQLHRGLISHRLKTTFFASRRTLSNEDRPTKKSERKKTKKQKTNSDERNVCWTGANSCEGVQSAVLRNVGTSTVGLSRVEKESQKIANGRFVHSATRNSGSLCTPLMPNENE
jgi:hypothetical protein